MILKICDFGLAIDCNVERPVTRLGTPQYMPPEIVVNPYKTYPEQHKDNPDCYYDEKVLTPLALLTPAAVVLWTACTHSNTSMLCIFCI
jgi:serine/threonine protein kinase